MNRPDDENADIFDAIAYNALRAGFYWAGRGRPRPRPDAGGGQGFGRGGFGAPPGAGSPPWGGSFPGFPWSFILRAATAGHRARRGDIRSAILKLLAEGPRNGYQIMQELEERSRGAWRPSPGSIYPALSQLEDEGLVKAESVGTGRVFDLTEAGRTYVKKLPDERQPWEPTSWPSEIVELVVVAREAVPAIVQIAQTGDPELVAKAKKVLVNAKRELYRILAEQDEDES
jgi:DNA-binding PadR family transcriptional regulator